MNSVSKSRCKILEDESRVRLKKQKRYISLRPLHKTVTVDGSLCCVRWMCVQLPCSLSWSRLSLKPTPRVAGHDGGQIQESRDPRNVSGWPGHSTASFWAGA
jgi:hypothetical protein